MLLIGDIDLNDRTAYRWSEPDDAENWETSDWPRRFADVDTYGVSRSNKVNDVLTFNIICLGSNEADGDGAIANFKALRDEVEQARLFEVYRKRRGSYKTVQRAIPGQSDPDIFTIKRYQLHRVNLALGSIGQVHCQLTLFVVEGLIPQDASPVPARWRWLAPPLAVTLSSLVVMLSPAAWAWGAPEIAAAQGAAPPLVPEIAPWTWSAPTAEVAGPTPLLLADFDPADQALVDGDLVDAFTDSSGNGHDLTGPVSHRPIYRDGTIYGGPHDLWPFLRFAGNEILRSTDTDVAPVGTDERIIFVVFRTNSGDPMNIVSYGPGSTNGMVSLGTEGGTYAVKAYFWGTEGSPKDTGYLGVWNVVALQVNPSGNPLWWINGDKQAADFGQHPVTGVDIFNIGGRTGNNGDFDGDIARVRVFSGMTDATIAAQFQHLLGKYR